MSRRKRKSKILARFELIGDFGPGLKGLGGLQTSRIRALKGSTFGAASAGRRLSKSERDAIEAEMRLNGKL